MATLTSSLSFKGNVFPIDINADCIASQDGIVVGDVAAFVFELSY
jgi:hypothetical protein